MKHSYLAFLVEIRSLQKKYDSCIKLLFYFKSGLRFCSVLWRNLVTKEFCLGSLFTVNNSRDSVAKSIYNVIEFKLYNIYENKRKCKSPEFNTWFRAIKTD